MYLLESFWFEAFKTDAHILDRVPSMSFRKTPFQL